MEHSWEVENPVTSEANITALFNFSDFASILFYILTDCIKAVLRRSTCTQAGFWQFVKEQLPPGKTWFRSPSNAFSLGWFALNVEDCLDGLLCDSKDSIKNDRKSKLEDIYI